MLDLEYVQRMVAWLLFTPADEDLTALQAVQLGLGAAALTKFHYKTLGMRTTAIEINPQVIAACRGWFKLPPDNERLQVLQADAGQAIRPPRLAGRGACLASGFVRPRSGRAGAGQCRVLCRLPRHARPRKAA